MLSILRYVSFLYVLSFVIFDVSGVAHARDRIHIVGSSTVFPYTQAVAEEFSSLGGSAPTVESTGTGGGMKLFCSGLGANTPDITGASRRIKPSELALCAENGVDEITEVQIGYDGLSIAVSRDGTVMDVSFGDLFLALSAEVPVDGVLVSNPYMRWNEVNASLPDIPIRVYGPPPTSGTRDAFVELAMHGGCESLDFFKSKKASLDKNGYKSYVKDHCSRMRLDGAFIEAGENDNLIVRRLTSDPEAYGIFGYSFFYENQDVLQAVEIDGVAPSLSAIGDGSYKISRPLFFYIKNPHRSVIAGLEDFIDAYMSEDALGEDGYLAERGLVSLSPSERESFRSAVRGREMNILFSE